ncbi:MULTISPECIES: helix-turn-helix transcriptional regulator [unclassified Streptomyces]|uniref:AraC family transcriptional regulator n=1 Tax=unclassified Streptomyces TaxID=2593676 RepID=UPI0022574107|nr:MULTISPECIES: helix-turn-helix transcriptional regulator [unclassified Streptomyces]MCX5063064.1 AraC family transcriptional regulator [Streptomyces sp. NBC_00452]
MPVCRPGLAIAMASLGELRGIGGMDFLASPHQLDFHQIVLVTAGRGTYEIDSTPLECKAGTLLWTRPNQVIRFRPQPDMDADVIMFTEAFPLKMTVHMGMLDDVLRPSHWQLCPVELPVFQRVLSVLKEEFARPDQGFGEELLRHLLAVVLLHIDQLCRSRHHQMKASTLSTDQSELFLRFRHELDRHYRDTRLVEDYANALNCSTRALARACRTVADTSAKDVIDARVALEARRLLAHTDLPITAIARQLGFSEVTNFGKFFARRVSMTPGAFRRESKGNQ